MGKRKSPPNWLPYGVGLLLVVIGIIVVSVLSAIGVGPIAKLPSQTLAGTSEFAIFYLMAQLIERLLELVSEAFPKDTKGRAVSMWGAASFLGMLLCYGTVGLFQVVG